MSARRWKEGYDPLADSDAAAFLALRRFLGQKDHDSSPDAVLLENVGAVLHQSRVQQGANSRRADHVRCPEKAGWEEGRQIWPEVLEGVLGENVRSFVG